MENRQKMIEERAVVLDYLKHGYSTATGGFQGRNSIAQAVGINHLTILELIPKHETFLQPQEEVYIGSGKRDQIHHTKGRIPFDKLTHTARAELVHAIEKIVADDEKRFIVFFNKAQPLSMRMHQLELLPGLGKKHMWEIIEARKSKPFEGFDDIKERVKLLPDPKSLIVKRIVAEIQGKEKYRIFARG